MSRVLLFKFQRISLSRDEADKYKTALRHIGLVANKMQPKQKGQVGGGVCEVHDCNTIDIIFLHGSIFVQILDCMRHSGFCVDDLRDMGQVSSNPVLLTSAVLSIAT